MAKGSASRVGAQRADIRVGISGWRYPRWRGDFYPKGLVQRRELAYAADRLSSIEINGTFYALQRPSSFRAWHSETPDDFVFAVKGGRFITHMKKLADVEQPLATFFAQGVLELGAKLGPLLWQLPPMLGFDEARLDDFFGLLPRTTVAAVELARHHDSRLTEEQTSLRTDADRPLRHALEVRHASFATDAALDVCRRHDVALVVADTAGKWPRIEEPTSSSFVYVRLHGDQELYTSGYTDEALDRWAERVRRWRDGGRDVYVYFDNDAKVRAPFDAMALIARLSDSPSARD